jgi:glutathione S-transferase
MTSRRLLIHSIFLLLLPLVVAWFGISVTGALFLVLVALAWRWLITLSGIIKPEKVPDLELETISVSHFVEKVRWCMDRLDIDYQERQVVGLVGVFFAGRSVPLLKIKTGLVRSTIGNSPEILRYLWGQYSAELGEKADFLKPTRERMELEKRLDRYGVDLQVWAYYHILDDKELTQRVWGCNSLAIPAWQRYLVIAIFPVLRFLLRKAFKITEGHYRKSVEHIEKILSEMDACLSDGRVSILGEESINYVDITFASLSSVWLQPIQFGNGKSDDVRVDVQEAPVGMRNDMERWLKIYPNASAFINRLYDQER